MRRSPLSLLLAFLSITGCVGAVTAARTRPELETTGRAVARSASRSVMVLSPSVLADVGVESAIPQRPFFEPPTTAVERELFEAGWNPVPRPDVVKAATTHNIALSLRNVTGREGSNLVDVAAALGPASTADTMLLVNGWRTMWEPVADGRTQTAHLCALAAELRVSLHDRSGRLLWEARAHGRATDLYDLTIVGSPGTADLSHPLYACASRDSSCGDCPTRVDEGAIRTLAAHTARTVVKDLAGR